MPFSKEKRVYTANGIFFTGLFALASLYLASFPFISEIGISSLVISIVLGIIYSNTLRHGFPKDWEPGLQFSAKKLLRLAIILYGFRISFQQIIAVGMHGIIIDSLVVIGTLLVGYFLGKHLFKLEKDLSLLISIGAAICGAAAVLAAEDILKSAPYKTTVAIATVVLFGTLSMFIYPMLQKAGMFGFNETQFGIFAGASIHEVAQVVVAGNNVGVEAGNIGVIVKMTRVLLLVPVLIMLSWLYSSTQSSKNKIVIPWFAFGFIVVISFNSLHLLPEKIVALINQFDIFLLTMAMAAIGIETNLAKIKNVGIKPFYLSIILCAWLLFFAWALVKFI